MIPALLRHKLTLKQTNMEDILTSNVFGLLKYVQPPECGVFRFLAKAQTHDGRLPLANLLTKTDLGAATVKYDFWPRWDNCEPDVVLEICGSSRILVAVEAKYRSGKSSMAADDEDKQANDPDEDTEDNLNEDEIDRCPADQLAKEWADLVAKASKLNAQPVLVYLTAHLRCPEAEMVESIDDCNEGSSPPMICWLSWRELSGLFRDSKEPHLADLAALAAKIQLTFYEGIAEVAPIRADWIFQGPTWRFDVASITCDWRFKQ